MNTSGIGKKYRQDIGLALSKARGIITPSIVSQTSHVSQQEAGRILSRLNKQGWVKRVKRGAYISVEVGDATGEAAMEDSWVLADFLFSPGYIAGFSAVKYWDFSEQLFESTTFFTTKQVKNRDGVMGNTRFQLKTIMPYKMFGTVFVWRGNSKICVSDPSKTVIDLLDDPGIVGGMQIVKDIFLEYKKSKHVDFKKLIEYAKKMKNKTIIKRLGFLLEKLGLEDMIIKYKLLNKISRGYSLFDPSVKNALVVRKWNLKVPANWK